MLIKMQKAQSTLEYALLIGVVVGALISMQNYLKRSVEGKLQIVGDQIGDPYSPGLTKRDEYMKAGAGTITETTYRGVTTDTRGSGDAAAIEGMTKTVLEGGYQGSESKRQIKGLEEEKWPSRKEGGTPTP